MIDWAWLAMLIALVIGLTIALILDYRAQIRRCQEHNRRVAEGSRLSLRFPDRMKLDLKDK